jgi:uncharacterized membrane protein
VILVALLTILLGSYALLALISRRLPASRRGRISLALLFLVTGIGHFATPEPMAAMLPAWVPARLTVIYVTGLLEWAGAIGLLVPRYSRLAGICLLLFLAAVFPANVFAAINRVAMGGHEAGPMYLIVRGPFQLLLMWWTYHFAVRERRDARPVRTAERA